MSVKNSIIVQKLVFRLPLVVRNEVVIRPPLLFTTQNHYPDLGEWFTSLCFTESSMESRFVIPFSSTACPDKI